ncbi:acyltransferase [Flavobacterium sp.]|uniref:acyltransferase n=1 Tax=Flavobacterium sp. TaxID=239 RepID=UPI003751A8C8
MNKIKNLLVKIFLKMLNLTLSYKQDIEIEALKKKFKKIGFAFRLGTDYRILNPQYVEIGENFGASSRFRLEVTDSYGDQTFSPTVKIGNNVIFHTDVHIGCINKIEIGDDCLFASRIFITDHYHGDTSIEMIKLPPRYRPLVTSGPVIIKNNVWIGEGVAIMPNVTIGENCIIATNAVVTKSIPPNSVAAGIPAIVIKTIQ